jgi:hypothetical protein
VAEPADSLNGDEITGLRAAVAKRIEGGDAGAEKRGGFGGVEPIGHLGDGFRGREHVFGVAAVVRDAADSFVDAVDEIAASALQAGAIVSRASLRRHADLFSGW